MFDFYGMEQRAREASRPLSSREREILRFLEEEQEQTAADGPTPIRRRLASAIVGLGLKLDPEALTLGGRRVAMEGAHVRD